MHKRPNPNNVLRLLLKYWNYLTHYSSHDVEIELLTLQSLDSDGCQFVDVKGSNIECECDHLTSFAVLMQFVQVRQNFTFGNFGLVFMVRVSSRHVFHHHDQVTSPISNVILLQLIFCIISEFLSYMNHSNYHLNTKYISLSSISEYIPAHNLFYETSNSQCLKWTPIASALGCFHWTHLAPWASINGADENYKKKYAWNVCTLTLRL